MKKPSFDNVYDNAHFLSDDEKSMHPDLDDKKDHEKAFLNANKPILGHISKMSDPEEQRRHIVALKYIRNADYHISCKDRGHASEWSPKFLHTLVDGCNNLNEVEFKPKKVMKGNDMSNVLEKFDGLIKMVKEEVDRLEKIGPIVGAAITGLATGAGKEVASHYLDKKDKKKDEAKKVEELKKPPEDVGKEFIDTDKDSELPEKKKDKTKKSDGYTPAKGDKPATIDYTKLPGRNKPLQPKWKISPDDMPAARARVQEHTKEMKTKYGMNKAELYSNVTSEKLTKSIRATHSDAEITEMLKCAVDAGVIHRNVLMEWQNFKTINPSIVLSYDNE
jgi:hypothetical protein